MWIEDYREANGLELDDFARRVNIVGKKMTPRLVCTVSDTLIHILERSKNPRTHPRIADAIATTCGATAEQRDSIVDEKWRGTWEPMCITDLTTDNANVEKEYKVGYEHPVVMVDENAHIVKRYRSLTAAENHTGVSLDMIRGRCRRQVKCEMIEGYTFRYASEWEDMTMMERLKDIGVETSEY